MDGMLDSYGKGGSEDEESSEEPSELQSAASAAFPDQEWDESRLSALKDLIMLCSGSDYAAGDDDEETKPGSKGPGKDVLALMFGKPEKKQRG